MPSVSEQTPEPRISLTSGAAGRPGSHESEDVHPAQGAGVSGRALAESLAGPLMETCEGRLDDLAWFRTDWQRGGAATAKGRWRRDDGVGIPVVVKVPVNARELIWMRRLQVESVATPWAKEGPVIPRLFASGEVLGAFDLAWIVIEQLPHGPLGGRWHEEHIPRVAEAIARFHAEARRFAVDREPRRERWDVLLASAREAVKTSAVPQGQRWTAALRELGARADGLIDSWERRQPLEWLHGDLHLANAMSRAALDRGPVCLIDLAEVHVGHWIEDAVYLERQLWAKPDRLRPHKPVKCIAERRRALGCDNGEDHPRLAGIRRLLLSATAPAFLKSEGAPGYLAACLERLEEGLRHVK